jgi:enoyl-CoA hydratase/carnithine racemase
LTRLKALAFYYIFFLFRLKGPSALIITSVGKFFSNGNDLQWLKETGKPPTAMAESLSVLLAKIATLPIPVVAAVNGHGFAGGCLLAMAADYRVMRSERGSFFEVVVTATHHSNL